MPIKFRCQHCRQFLGIAHSKAGSLVDCPTCGRTIRVPNPEGKVEPLPELKLNLQDVKLASALDELAGLGRGAEANFEPESAVAVADAEGTPKPPTAAAAVAPPPPIAAAPIRVEPLLPAKAIPLEMHDPHKPAPVASMNELAALANLPTARDNAAERPVVESEAFANGFGAVRNVARRGVAISWVVSIALVSAWLGFVVGRWERTPPANPVAKNEPLKNGVPQKAASPNGHAPDPFTSAPREPAVRGRITFKTDAGEQRPDRGARIVLLPEKREGTRKLSVVGFRSSDSETDTELAAADLRKLGGDVALVNDAGNFELHSLKAGTYRVLALSHFQPRDEKEPLDPSLKGILDNFFDRSEQLLGKCRYHLGQLKYSGNETELWDFSFERE